MENVYKKHDGTIAKLNKEIMNVLREEVNDLGGEFDLTANDYGFRSVWIENECEVWWDKNQGSMKMDELTELCALHETIVKTIKELEDDEKGNG